MYPEGTMRQVLAPEFKTNGVMPIAVEKYEGGEWKRLGYVAGFGPDGHIISIDDWLLSVTGA